MPDNTSDLLKKLQKRYGAHTPDEPKPVEIEPALNPIIPSGNVPTPASQPTGLSRNPEPVRPPAPAMSAVRSKLRKFQQKYPTEAPKEDKGFIRGLAQRVEDSFRTVRQLRAEAC